MADEDKDPTQAFQNRLKKYDGDAMAFATALFDDNWQLREKVRQAEGKAPAEGSVVLNKTDAARWEAFKALGKKPEEISAALTEADTAKTEAARLARKDKLRDVADVGFGGSKLKLSVLEKLDGEVEGAEYDIREGKDGKAVYVKHGGKETPLEQFATETWADFVPALKADGGSGNVKRGLGGDPAPAGPSSLFDRIRTEKKKENEQQAGTVRTLAEVAGRRA